MKTLYLVRHAKSSWDYPHLADIDRPLNHRGEKNAPEMGKRLKEKGIKPDLLISSPAERAHKTALAIAREIGYDEKKIEINDSLYHAGEGSMLEIIQFQPDHISSLMLFGHNPGFTYFANSLADISIDNIPTAGIVAMTFEASWSEVYYGNGDLLFFDYPKKSSQ